MRRHRSSEHGLALVLFALVMVTLMVFAALVVDVGALASARRADQNAADTGALAGVAEFADTDAALVQEVKDRVHETLGVTFTDEQWNSCGTASTTDDPDFVDTIVGGVSCITSNASAAARRQVQVRIPTQQLATAFGRVVGIDDFDHSAFAIAGYVSAGFGSVLPYGVPGSGSDSSQGCLKSPTSPHSEYPCDGPDEGHFGFLDFTYFGGAVDTVETCNGDVPGRLAHNTAMGADHDLSAYTTTQLRDDLECGATERSPNAVQSVTGAVTSAFGQGVYSGDGVQGSNDTAPYDARLRQTSPGLTWGTTTPVDGHPLDDNPLWEFIEPLDEDRNGVLSVPDSCDKSIFDEVLADDYSSLPTAPANVRKLVEETTTKAAQMRLLIDRCLTHYTGQPWDGQGAPPNGPIGGPVFDNSSCPSTGCTDPVFARNSSTSDRPDLYDIQYTSRFGYVPQLTTNPGTPADTPNVYRIARFRAVFIQRIVGGCTATSCGFDFEPGVPVVGNDAPNNGSAEAMTAWLFEDSILPNQLATENAPYRLGTNRFIRLVR